MLQLLGALVGWSLRNRATVLLLTLLFVAVGLRSAAHLKMDAVPDITDTQVQVITSSPALSPVEIEQYVTVPVERSLAGIPGTREIRSISKYGVSVVTVAFEDGTDIHRARQHVGERLVEAREAVSSRHGAPVMGPITSGLGEVIQFTLRNPRLTAMQLEEQLDWFIAPQLRMVPGVVEVNSFGGEDRQYEVLLEPARLDAMGLSVAQVAEAIERSNANAGGGYIERNGEHFVIGTDGLVKSREDLERVVVGATSQGAPITLATVAEVRFGARLRRGAATRNGEGEVVVGVAMMLLGENARTVTAAVKARLATLQPSLPPGTEVELFYDRGTLVDRIVATLGSNLLEGAALVVLVLLLLLGDLRAGLVVALTIPLSLLFAVAVMQAFGLSGNLMSLGAIDFGLLVDGAVIIVENVVRRLGEERPEGSEARIRTVERATLEVRAASIFGEAVIAIVYLPVLALTGVEGKLFVPMATTVLLALIGAFLCSLTVTPVMASLLLRGETGHHETLPVRLAGRLYAPALRAAMQRPRATVLAGLLSLGVAVLAFQRLGAEFVPQLQEGDLLIEARRLTGASLSESVRTDLQLEKALMAIPEIKGVVARTGSPELATDPMSLESSDIYLSIRDAESWRPGTTRESLAAAIHEVLDGSLEIGGALSQPIQMRTNELVAGIRSDVGVLIYGPDLTRLSELGAVAMKRLRSIPGVQDLKVEQLSGLPYLRIRPDRARLARHGLTIDDVNQATETLAVGHRVGEVLEGERRFGIVIRMAHGFRGDLEVLRALPLRSLGGAMVPLGDVAELAFETGPAQVSREGLSRRLTVEFNVRGRDLLSVVNEAQAALASGVALPTGYRLTWGGQFLHYEQARARLGVVVPVALALILFLLWSSFGSARAALLIFLGVPFATVGGVLALSLRGLPFSISAGVGFIALFGVAVLNGLVLVAFARDEETRGLGAAEAIALAAERRLRPVLTTALVAALGFVPMALSTAPGSEVQRPLATVVIGGLGSATLLTLLLLPVLYAAFGSARRAPQGT